jgi:hypothetical protein
MNMAKQAGDYLKTGSFISNTGKLKIIANTNRTCVRIFNLMIDSGTVTPPDDFTSSFTLRKSGSYWILENLPFPKFIINKSTVKSFCHNYGLEYIEES